MSNSGFKQQSRDFVPSQQEASSPEDETGSSFHTPQHAPLLYGESALSFVTSQDSIDVFHDAYSTLKSSYGVPDLSTRHQNSPGAHHRTRHASSGPKFEDNKQISGVTDEWNEEASERTCMLQKCPLERVRHSSCGQGSLSCNTSPFHGSGRLSHSSSSLKRRSADRIYYNNPQDQQSHKHQPASLPGIMNHVPYPEVDIIRETDEEVKTPVNHQQNRGTHTQGSTEGDLPSSLSASQLKTQSDTSTQTPVNRSNAWMKNYVPCAELEIFLNGERCKSEKWAQNALLICDSQDLEKVTENNSSQIYSVNKMRNRNSCCQRIREEFSLSNFRMNHHGPHLFVTSQWQHPNELSCLYLAYRLFWGVYFLMWSVWSWIGFGGYDASYSLKLYYMIYLTNWSIWLLACDTLLQAVNVTLHMKKIADEGSGKYYRMKKRFKISWILSNITVTMHIFITLLFWTVIYRYTATPFSPIGVNTHVIPCCYVIMDLFISATPRRVLHAYQPMVYLTSYGIFTDIYYLSGGKNPRGDRVLYPILDWSEPYETVLLTTGLVLILVPLIHTLVAYVFYTCKVKLWRSLKIRRYVQGGCETETAQSLSREEKV